MPALRLTISGFGISFLLATAAFAQTAPPPAPRVTGRSAAPIVAKPLAPRQHPAPADTGRTGRTGRTGTLAHPYEYTEQMPEFPGGDGALREFLAQHIVYPAAARQASVEGRVFLKFVVDEQGQVQHPVVIKSLGSGLDEEAVRVVKLLPRFAKAGRQNGAPVCVYYSVPVAFSLK